MRTMVKQVPYVNLAGQHRPLKGELLEAIGHVFDGGWGEVKKVKIQKGRGRVARFIDGRDGGRQRGVPRDIAFLGRISVTIARDFHGLISGESGSVA